MNLIDLALLFLRTGVVSFGGGTSVVADLQHELVDRTGASHLRGCERRSRYAGRRSLVSCRGEKECTE